MCMGGFLRKGERALYNCRTELPRRPSTVQTCTMFFTFSMEPSAMRLHHSVRHARVAAIALVVVATSVSAFGQSGQFHITEGVIKSAAGQVASQPQETTRPLSIDDAVKLGLEQNLGIQIQRIDPQISDLGVAQARSFWAPQLSSTILKNSNNQPITSALAGA